MTTYRAIASTETDPGKPMTSQLAKAFTDNVIAIGECDSTAPSNLFPTVLLGTLSMTSGTTQTLSGLTLQPYRGLLLIFQNVGVTTGASAALELRVDGAAIYAVTATTYASVRARCYIDLNTGVGDATSAVVTGTAPVSATGTGWVIRTTLGTGSTSVSVSHAGNASTFSAGSVRIYGVK